MRPQAHFKVTVTRDFLHLSPHHTYVGLRQTGLGEDGAEEGVLVALTVAGLRTDAGQCHLTQTSDSGLKHLRHCILQYRIGTDQ
jgi:hypothetical protein